MNKVSQIKPPLTGLTRALPLTDNPCCLCLSFVPEYLKSTCKSLRNPCRSVGLHFFDACQLRVEKANLAVVVFGIHVPLSVVLLFEATQVSLILVLVSWFFTWAASRACLVVDSVSAHGN